MPPALHFIGFRDDRFHAAVKVWGRPDFYHRRWDERARQELAPGDVAIFSYGDEHAPRDPHSFDDSREF